MPHALKGCSGSTLSWKYIKCHPSGGGGALGACSKRTSQNKTIVQELEMRTVLEIVIEISNIKKLRQIIKNSL